MLPYAENRITSAAAWIDYGVPIARIEFKYRENERKMMTEMYQTAAAILKEAKAEILPYDPNFMGMPGTGDPRAFDLPHGRRPEAQRAERLLPDARREERFRGGRRGFTSASEKNPTLTILALAWRATDYLAAEMKSRRLHLQHYRLKGNSLIQ